MGKLSQKPSTSLILNNESAVIDIITKEAFWPNTAPATQIVDFHMHVSGSTEVRLPHVLQWQNGPQTSTWPPAPVWEKASLRSPAAALIMNINMVSGGSMDHKHQDGIWRQHSLSCIASSLAHLLRFSSRKCPGLICQAAFLTDWWLSCWSQWKKTRRERAALEPGPPLMSTVLALLDTVHHFAWKVFASL